MIKKPTAFLLAVLLVVGMTACGNDGNKAKEDTPSTTVTTQPTASVGSSDSAGGTSTSSAPTRSDDTDTAEPTDTAATTDPARPSGSTGASATTSTTYAPSGEIVPIGTKPTTSTTAPTTTTVPPTTVTTTAPSSGGSSTGSTVNSTTTTITTTTTTKPTEPPVQGPQIILPSIGSDIDVTNKKNRIRVSAVAAWFEENGTIGVQLTFKNYSSNWITEETDYVQYTCYDKDGKVVQKSTKLMIGVIDTKKNKEKAYTFTVPATTYEVRITKSKIVYWTEWA